MLRATKVSISVPFSSGPHARLVTGRRCAARELTFQSPSHRGRTRGATPLRYTGSVTVFQSPSHRGRTRGVATEPRHAVADFSPLLIGAARAASDADAVPAAPDSYFSPLLIGGRTRGDVRQRRTAQRFLAFQSPSHRGRTRGGTAGLAAADRANFSPLLIGAARAADGSSQDRVVTQFQSPSHRGAARAARPDGPRSAISLAISVPFSSGRRARR